MTNKLGIVILAAGKGKRMGGNHPKVLFKLNDKPLIDHVLDATTLLNPAKIVVVTGFGREQVEEHLAGLTGVEFAYQEIQNGTGHAVQYTAGNFEKFDGDVLVLAGDVPLIQSSDLEAFLEFHRANGQDATVMTAIYEDPFGYGRIVKENGNFVKIVEQKDANEEEQKINEINTGIMVFKCRELFKHLNELKTDNKQGELYLTDMVEIFLRSGLKVSAKTTAHPERTYGINTQEQLAEMEKTQ